MSPHEGANVNESVSATLPIEIGPPALRLAVKGNSPTLLASALTPRTGLLKLMEIFVLPLASRPFRCSLSPNTVYAGLPVAPSGASESAGMVTDAVRPGTPVTGSVAVTGRVGPFALSTGAAGKPDQSINPSGCSPLGQGLVWGRGRDGHDLSDSRCGSKADARGEQDRQANTHGSSPMVLRQTQWTIRPV